MPRLSQLASVSNMSHCKATHGGLHYDIIPIEDALRFVQECYVSYLIT